MRQPGGAATEGARDTDACRVLVVDDHPHVLESLAMLLELHGHEVATARDGLEAVDVAGRFRPDLMLLDLSPVSFSVGRRARGLFLTKRFKIIFDLPIPCCIKNFL